MRRERWQKLKDLFDAALEKEPEERAAFLHEACADDPVLRREVESLLQAHSEQEGPVEQLKDELASSLQGRISPTVSEGQQVGPYEIIEELGHGGMGRVFLARRADGQFDQQVALKLLGIGFPSHESRQRFLAERQILATLNHRHIARLLDGGVTDDGQPYFALEVVEGEPIDTYCNARDLSIKERLALFLDVCDAVHYAHRKLVVHRDLKPSNILVAPVEAGEQSRGTVKLLDFGIAKLLDPEVAGSQAIPRTQTGFLPMTPSYASPEQVRGESITTASDVYQLGVVLYELLTGVQPYDVEGRTPSEIERIICEEKPTRPSTAVTQAATASSTERSFDSVQRQLRGDLDTIVMKALRKEPGRRYESVEQLAEDIRRYLEGRPVSAHPDSWTYRGRKFVRRHRWGVGVVAVILVLLAGYAVTITWHSQQTQEALDRAEAEADKAEQVTGFMIDLFQASDPSVALGDTITARELMERGVQRAEQLGDQPEIQAEMLDVVGQVYGRLGRYGEATSVLEQSLALRNERYGRAHPNTASTMVHLASVLRRSGDYSSAEETFREALAIQEETLGPDHPDVAPTRSLLGGVLMAKGQLEEAESSLRRALVTYEELDEPDLIDRSETLNILGLVLRDKGAWEESEAALREALGIREAELGTRDPRVAMSMNNLAMVLRQSGDPEAAEPVYREALAVKRQLYDGAHPSTASTLNGLGLALSDMGDLEGAESVLREALEMRREALGPDHPRTAASLNNLGNVLEEKGYLDDAIEHLTNARSVLIAAVGETHPLVAVPATGLGRILMTQDRYQEAEPHLREALAIREQRLPPGHVDRIEVMAMLAACLTELNQFDEAETLLVDAHDLLEEHHLEAEEELWGRTLENLVRLYEQKQDPESIERFESQLAELRR